MPRQDETEVIDSTHVADSEGDVTSESGKSPAYTDTEVNSQERSVTFWNRALWSDSSTYQDRKIKCEIEITGHNETFKAHVEHPYTSPLINQELKPEKEFSVPLLNLSEYTYYVKTNWWLYEKNGTTYSELKSSSVGPYTATVDDTDIGN